ncbi:hypothetical protein GGX14DRAFT_697460 [Mycena pura]|uniref:Uncharacterized protein n=1 Tax=Mycena pura TaxID=153505 RepID=A0AAD6VJ08_9AGAR|nr:hypothetical protein GGX14DRAFT_697460 [Mycena pura]
MTTLIDLLTKRLHMLTTSHARVAAAHAQSRPHRPFACSYCSDPSHLICNCPLVLADIRAGVCKRNARGRVVLPSGLYVPHSISGQNLRTRITEYRRQHESPHCTPEFSCDHIPNPSLSQHLPTPPVSSPNLDNICQSTLERKSAALQNKSDSIRLAALQQEVAANSPYAAKNAVLPAAALSVTSADRTSSPETYQIPHASIHSHAPLPQAQSPPALMSPGPAAPVASSTSAPPDDDDLDEIITLTPEFLMSLPVKDREKILSFADALHNTQ